MNVFQLWQLLLVTLAGWINRQEQDVIAYIQEEKRRNNWPRPHEGRPKNCRQA